MAGIVRYVFEKRKNDENKENFKKILENGFVELLGEVNPTPIKETMLMNKQSVSKNKESELKNSIPLYEYVWTVGIKGDPNIKKGHWCDELDKDDSIGVQLIFHTNKSKFSIREISATLKQLPPFEKKKGIGGWVESISPVANVFGKGLETMGVSYGKILTNISEMQLNSASTKDFPWWIKSIAVSENPGVEWHISKSYLQSVGNRFVGTLGIYFVECETYTEDLKPELEIEIKVFLQKDSKTEERMFITELKSDKEKKGLEPNMYKCSIPDEIKDKRIFLKIIPEKLGKNTHQKNSN